MEAVLKLGSKEQRGRGGGGGAKLWRPVKAFMERSPGCGLGLEEESAVSHVRFSMKVRVPFPGR